MEGLDVETSLKVIVVGNGMVGKSTLISKFVHGHVSSRYKKTIGTEYAEKEIRLPSGEDITLMVWDTAGQDMFSALTKSYYVGAAAVVYVFSTTDRESLLAIENWRARVLSACGCEEGTEPLSVLVQTKVDLMSEAQVTFAEADALANRLRMPLFRLATTNETPASELFPYIAARHLRTVRDAAVGVAGALTASTVQKNTGVATLSSFARPNALEVSDADGGSGLHAFPVPLSTTARQIYTNEFTFGQSGSSEEALASANAALAGRANFGTSASQPFVPYWDRTDIVLPKEPLTRRGKSKKTKDDCTIA